MVGNIAKGMLAGTKMLSERPSTWNEGVGGAVVSAVSNAAAARAEYMDREKQLVWKRLNLEAANLQNQQLEAIRGANSIDEVPAILDDFEKKIKANMDGQKWGKEWMEELSPSYFAANRNDVKKAFDAKKKEFLGIELNNTLTSYADNIANAGDEAQAEFLLKDAESLIDAGGWMSPSEKENTKANLKSLIANKKKDSLTRRKQMIAEEKLNFGQQIADLQTKAIDGTLSREELDAAKRAGIFKYNPDKYNKILGYKDKQERSFANNDDAIAEIHADWENMTEEKLQAYNHAGAINDKTYNHLSAQLAKRNKAGSTKNTEPASEDNYAADLLNRAWDGEDVEKEIAAAVVNKKLTATQAAEIRKAIKQPEAAPKAKKENKSGDDEAVDLLNRALSGEDVEAEVAALVVNKKLTATQAKEIRDAASRQKGYGENYVDALADIKDDKITEDYQIDELGLSKQETTDLKTYLKDYKGYKAGLQKAEEGRLKISYNDLLKGINNGEYDNEGDLKAMPDWDKYSADDQTKAIKWLADKKKNTLLSQYNNIAGQIVSGAISSRDNIDAMVLDYGWSYKDKAGLQKLYDMLTAKENDVYGVYEKALKTVESGMGGVFFKNKTNLELEQLAQARQWVYSVFQQARENGNNASEIAEMLSPDKIMQYLSSHRVTQEDIQRNASAVSLEKTNLERQRDEVIFVDEKDKSKKWQAKKNATLYSIMDYRNNLGIAFKAGTYDYAEYQKLLSQTNEALLDKMVAAENESGDDTVLSTAFRGIVQSVGEENIDLDQKAQFLQEAVNLLKSQGVNPDDKMSGWFWDLEYKDNRGNRYSGDQVAGAVVIAIKRRYLKQKYPNLTDAEVKAVVDGNKLIRIDELGRTVVVDMPKV